MSDRNRVSGRTRRARPPTARTAAALLATAALAVPAAAWGSGPTSTSPGGSSKAGGSANSELLAFSGCMRSHGVPNFPDPQPGQTNAKFPGAQQLDVSSSQYNAAVRDCQHLLPAGTGDQFPTAEVQLLLIGMLKFSQCMRSHAVPNWPDPSLDPEGRPVFDLGRAGISRSEARSPQIATKMADCQYLLPRALGGVPVGGS
jgi:hypothetical protein